VASRDQRLTELEAQVARLEALVLELQAQLVARDRRIAELERQLHQAQEDAAKSKRAGKRQAAPFRRKTGGCSKTWALF